MNIVVFPYRDYYFASKYGLAVRDLHIIEALDKNIKVNKVFVINRPSLFIERVMFNRKMNKDSSFSDKVKFVDINSSFFIPKKLSKRYFVNCLYKSSMKRIMSKIDCDIDLVLDFMPSLKIDYKQFNGALVWYDSIDNFSKHNRYSDFEKKLVLDKYKNGLKNASIVTGVSFGAIDEINNNNKQVVSNGLQSGYSLSQVESLTEKYDFGFIGFITNKFDLKFIEELSIKGYKIAIYGDFYDESVRSKLKEIKNVKCFGRFKHDEISSICSQFKIGLIPYKKELSHDESPLKLYQYLANGLPVISTIEYEVKSDFVHYFSNETNLMDFLKKNLLNYDIAINSKIINSCDKNWFWDKKINNVFDCLGLNNGD